MVSMTQATLHGNLPPKSIVFLLALSMQLQQPTQHLFALLSPRLPHLLEILLSTCLLHLALSMQLLQTPRHL